MSNTITYRPDIDGLRAVAVLPVVLFHLDPSWMPGGFVGVDIFFVISGFLITSILIRQHREGSFSFAEFYRRRIKRIVPVLNVTILVSLIVGYLVLLPKDLAELGLSAAASQLFIGNVYFTYFLDTSYFADDAALQPLLHLWSLGVEEQFYLLWPLVLFVGLRYSTTKPWVLVISVVALILASFTYGELGVLHDPMFHYYMLPSRAGELLAGATVAMCVANGATPGRTAPYLGIFGGGLVVFSLVMLSEHASFPGLNAVPVTLGVSLLLFAGIKENWVSKLLSVKPLIWFGLISYSMYLWHWPLLAYMKYIFVDIGVVAKLACFVAITGLAYFSYRTIEVPYRTSQSSFGQILVRYFAIPTALICSMGFFAAYGADQAEEKQVAELFQPPFSADYVCQASRLRKQDLQNPACIINATEEPRALLWGDSNAAHYTGVLREIAEAHHFSFRNIAHSACPPVLDEPQRFTTASRRKTCRASGRLVRKQLADYEVIFISASWDFFLARNDFENAFEKTVAKLVGMQKKVIVLGRIPRIPTFDRHCGMKAQKVPFIDCESASTVSAGEMSVVNAQIREIAERHGASYLDFNAGLCEAGICSGYIGAEPIYYDGGHLSVSGAVILGKKLRQMEFEHQVFEAVRESLR